MKGMTAEFRAFLDNPQSTLAHAKALRQVSVTDKKPGLYILIVGGYLYVGKSQDMYVRGRSHKGEVYEATDNSPRTKAARRHSNFTQHPAFFLPQQDELAITAGEQAGVLTCQIYYSSVLPNDQSYASATAAQSSTEPASSSRFLYNKKFAKVMTDIAQKAFSKVQWHGMVKRASFGATGGLNSNSPISENPYLKQEWARVDTPEMLVFRRTTPYKVTAKHNDIRYVFKESNGHPVHRRQLARRNRHTIR